MAWVTWRQHRMTLAGVAALVGAAALYVLITGLQMRHAYAAVTACRPATSQACQQVTNNFYNTYAYGAGVIAALLQVVPPLIGAFAGAPVLARELETGTFRYAWTQGFGRWRWAAAKLVPMAVVVTLAAGAFSLLFSWGYEPWYSAGDSSPLQPTAFDLIGVAFAAWTLAAFAIGALAGLLIRRVVPTMFTTITVWAGLALATGLWLRPHYQAPLLTSNPNIRSTQALALSEWWSRGGKPVGLGTIQQALGAIDVRAVTPQDFSPGPSTPPNVDPVQYLIQHGFTYLTSYQPVSRFWLFQSIEGGWLLVLSLLLIGATVWLVRRRAT